MRSSKTENRLKGMAVGDRLNKARNSIKPTSHLTLVKEDRKFCYEKIHLQVLPLQELYLALAHEQTKRFEVWHHFGRTG